MSADWHCYSVKLEPRIVETLVAIPLLSFVCAVLVVRAHTHQNACSLRSQNVRRFVSLDRVGFYCSVYASTVSAPTLPRAFFVRRIHKLRSS
jgi:hypothetical protein